MNPGERAWIDQQQRMLATGQWRLSDQGSGPSPEPLGENPVSARLDALHAAEQAQAAEFNYHAWASDRLLRMSPQPARVVPVSEECGPVISDFLHKAPRHGLMQVWIFQPRPDVRLLLPGASPTAHVAELRYGNWFKNRARMRAARQQLEREGKPDRAFRLTFNNPTRDSDTGHLSTPKPFYLLADGSQWAFESMVASLLPAFLADRAAQWLLEHGA